MKLSKIEKIFIGMIAIMILITASLSYVVVSSEEFKKISFIVDKTIDNKVKELEKEDVQ